VLTVEVSMEVADVAFHPSGGCRW